MQVEEANKIIAEYMGFHEVKLYKDGFEYRDKEDVLYFSEHYSKSLDALVPVWEKLDLQVDSLTIRSRGYGEFEVWIHGKMEWNNYSIQEAAAIATAKAIRELK